MRTIPTLRCLIGGLILLVGPVMSLAAKNDWAEGSPERNTGATRDYYNAAGNLPWKNFLGDWKDAENAPQGDAAYATVNVKDDDRGKFVEWNVTELVRQWQSGTHQNQGFFLRTLKPAGRIVFCSREHEDENHRPVLLMKNEKGEKRFSPEADTFLNKSTYRSQGLSDHLVVSGSPENTLIRFDQKPIKQAGKIFQATLRLYTTRQYGDAKIGVFRCDQGHNEPASEPILGLAKEYPQDAEIESHPDVIFATGFESENWNEEWTRAGKMNVIATVDEDKPRKFQALNGKALRVKIAEGSNGALNTVFKFGKETGKEPESVSFRYYLRLADNWNQTLQGGKMPGISGTYGVAGWGGRKVDGTDGWSARGLFGRTIPPGNPLENLHPIGTYCYHADMKGTYGDHWGWHRDYRGFLEKNRWYAIEQFLKMNTPGKNDGILRAWVDGRLAFEKTDIRFRDVDKLKIEQIWMNVYHGGRKPSPYDQHLFIDNVVVARKYVGPLRRK